MKKINILLVEDDEISYPIVTSIVKTVFDVVPDIVETGAEALLAVEKNVYDLILMDLALLESDGFRITQAIRNRDDLKKNTVIVAVTAYLNEAVQKICYKLGMNDVFDKPFSLDKCREIKDRFFATL